jgi:hypothetical protein
MAAKAFQITIVFVLRYGQRRWLYYLITNKKAIMRQRKTGKEKHISHIKTFPYGVCDESSLCILRCLMTAFQNK